MTTSPLDMEDIPSSLASNLSGLTHGRFRSLALVDAHNSLTGPATMTPEKVGALQEAALASLQISAEQQPTNFKVGVAHVKPANFIMKDGFGPGGISVIAVDVTGERFAYVCVDGNNMITGLREEIIGNLTKLGFDDGEVMTTDTHMVNGVVPARLGYHPVGEVTPRLPLLDHMVNGVVPARLGYHPVGEVAAEGPLLNEITSLCKEALRDLEEAEVGVVAGQIPVMTLGQKSLRHVMGTVYRTSKLTAITLFPMIVICTVLSLLFLVR
jgi:putative membrane protein